MQIISAGKASTQDLSRRVIEWARRVDRTVYVFKRRESVWERFKGNSAREARSRGVTLYALSAATPLHDAVALIADSRWHTPDLCVVIASPEFAPLLEDRLRAKREFLEIVRAHPELVSVTIEFLDGDMLFSGSSQVENDLRSAFPELEVP